MKKYFTQYLLSLISVGLLSCQNKAVKIIFENTQTGIATKKNATKIYTLKKKTANSDFDYSKLKWLDDITKDTLNFKPAFEPIGGNYTYYQFIASFKGEGCLEKEQDFHDILIIKTNQSNKIIDSYQYTLEWAEMPSQFDLYKLSAKDLPLTDNLDISLLKFIRTDYWDEKDKLLNEGGIIKLK